MPILLLLLVLASVALSATAQIFLKMGSGVIGARPAADLGQALFRVAASPAIWAGLALYGFSMVLWIFALSKLDVSKAYPFVGLGFLVTMALGFIVLREPLSWSRILGTLLVTTGCILVARSA